MTNTVRTISSIITIGIITLGSSSCDNEKGKVASTASISKAHQPTMSAKERLAKNNNLEKRLTWERNGLKGKVKKVTIKEYEANPKTGVLQKLPSTWQEHLYNANGYITETIEYMAGGQPDRRFVTMYDAHNNDTATYSYLPDGTVKYRTVTKNDDRGNEIGAASYNAKGASINGHQLFKYDSVDNLIEMAFYDEAGKMINKVDYTFDENGFKTGGKTYDSVGQLTSVRTCKYDAAGNYLYGTQYKPDGTFAGKDSSKYDNAGHRTVMVIYKTANTPDYKWTYKYDDHGNKTEYVSYDNTGKEDAEHSEYYEYQYDTTGNITRKTTYVMIRGKKTITTVTEYEYVYY